MSGLHFGVRFWTPKRGPFCRQNFKVTGRKIARGSIVSARTRQKFSMPLLFHGFAAPQALFLHARRTFMATHVLELYLFQGCINLAEVTVSEVPSPRSELNGLTQQDRTKELAPGCLSSTGIYTLVLPKHFVAIGAHACDSCRLLNSVDLRSTMIEEIPEFTFGHCTSLREVFLPTTLHTIRVKAFMSCAALVELAIPPALKCIGSRAFLDCGGWSKCPEHADGEGFMLKKMLLSSVRP